MICKTCKYHHIVDREFELKILHGDVPFQVKEYACVKYRPKLVLNLESIVECNQYEEDVIKRVTQI